MTSQVLATNVSSEYHAWNRAINSKDFDYLNSTIDTISELDLFNLLQIQAEHERIRVKGTIQVSNGDTLLHRIIEISILKQFKKIAIRIIDKLSATHLTSVFKIQNFIGKFTPFHMVMEYTYEEIALQIIDKVSKEDLQDLLTTKASAGPANFIDKSGDTPLDYANEHDLQMVRLAIELKVLQLEKD